MLFPTLCFLLVACSKSEHAPTIRLQGTTMGTYYTVTIFSPARNPTLDPLRQQIHQRLRHIESVASTYDTTAELARFNGQSSTQSQTVSPELCRMVERAIELGEQTNGAFDVSVGAAVNLWGFGPNDATSRPPTKDQIRDAKAAIGTHHLSTNCRDGTMRKNNADTLVDLSAFAKGYAVDDIAKLLSTNNVENFLVEIGGEIRGRGRKANGEPFKIGIESPTRKTLDTREAIHLFNRAIATSGDYRNFTVIDGRRYSHTIDPNTATPVTHTLTMVSVVDDSAATADALATALLVMGPDRGLKFALRQQIAALFIVRDGESFRVVPTPTFEKLLILD